MTMSFKCTCFHHLPFISLSIIALSHPPGHCHVVVTFCELYHLTNYHDLLNLCLIVLTYMYLETEIFTIQHCYIFSGLAGIAAIVLGRALYYRRYKRLASKYQHVEFSQYLIHTRVYAQGFFVVCATSIVAKPVFEYLWKKYVKPEDPSPSNQPKSTTNE